MAVLTFTMPTRSRASVFVSADLLVHSPDIETSWRDLQGERTLLIVICADDRAAGLKRLITAAHPKVEDTTPTPQDQLMPGVRRAIGRHRR